MAEDAAYLNVATSQANRPTIFELISEEGMQQCLTPAIQLMCQHLTQIQPELFTKFYDYFDELYLIFDLFLEGHYIWTHSASFGEHFYGLKRVNCSSIIDTFLNLNREAKNGEKLSLRSKVYSLIGLCVLPYLLSKSHKYFQSLQEKDWEYEIMSKKEEIIFKLYPCLDALTQISSLIFKFLYLTKKTEFYSFTYALQSLKLVRETDNSMLESNFPYFAKLRQRSLFLNLVLSPLGAANLIGYGFTHLLPFGIFLVKFLRHWYSQHGLGILELYNRLPTPPPPAKLDESDSSNCPICHKECHIPSVVSVSGWVYCYECITNHLRAEGRCPISGLSADIDDVIRVYADS